MPENLPDDYEKNPLLDYLDTRQANIAGASDACTQMIDVAACGTVATSPAGADKQAVCVKGEKQFFGLDKPVNKYPPGGVHNTPANQPDGIWVHANGICEYGHSTFVNDATLMHAIVLTVSVQSELS